MEKTSKRVAKKAAKVLRDKSASADARSVAASALTQSEDKVHQAVVETGWVSLRAVTKNQVTGWKVLPETFAATAGTSLAFAQSDCSSKAIIKTVKAKIVIECKA